MSPDLWGLLSAGVGGGAITQAISYVAGRRRERAQGSLIDSQAAQVIADTAVTLVAPLKAEILELTHRVDTLEAENAQTKTLLQLAIEHIRVLRDWIAVHVPDKQAPPPPTELGL